MTDLTAIRAALAANLRTVPDCQVSRYLLDTPTGPSLQVVGPREFEPIVFGSDHHSILMVVEGFVPGALDRGSHEVFDRWVTSTGDEDVWAALEADQELTSRLADDGTVTADQAAAADSVAVERFLGYQRAANGGLTGEWEVRILT